MGFLLLALQLIPHLVTAVESIHAGKTGAEKKKAVLDTIQNVAQAVGASTTNEQAIAISKAVDNTVGALNATGAFAK